MNFELKSGFTIQNLDYLCRSVGCVWDWVDRNEIVVRGTIDEADTKWLLDRIPPTLNVTFRGGKP